MTETDLAQLATDIKTWGQTLGFNDIGITNTDLSHYEKGYFNWIEQNFHGEMDYMVKHGTKRLRPAELEPGTQRVISCRMNYYDGEASNPLQVLKNTEQAYVSRYALNKDYHKLIRKRLQQLAVKISEKINHQYRVFCDSAPVLERAIAEKSGLGFTGKNSLIIHPRAGSYFFLAEIYTDIPLPIDPPFSKQGCGPCTACLEECPTQAIVAEGVIDARKCISYLTIEYDGVIDEALRPLIGNRIYGCDDCQLVCPWNRFSQPTHENSFQASPLQLDQIDLLSLFHWNEAAFLQKMAGSPIRRIGFERWQRNLAIALGNADYHENILMALEQQTPISDMVKSHLDWAIEQQKEKREKAKITRPGDFKEDHLSHRDKPKPVKAKKYYLPAQIKRLRSQ